MRGNFSKENYFMQGDFPVMGVLGAMEHKTGAAPLSSIQLNDFTHTLRT